MSRGCMFAGRGVQIPGMGKDFAEADAEVMGFFDKVNAVLGFDLKKICFEGPAEELTKSNVCQPAIFVTNVNSVAQQVLSGSKAMMLEQVTGTTNRAADVEAAKALGCTTFVEFGPGKVLSGLVKKIDAALTVTNVADLASLDAALSVVAAG